MPRDGASAAATGDTAKVPLPVRGPKKGRVGAGAARNHVDALGHHEGRIEADAEPADQRRLLVLLRRLDAIEERLGAGAGDGAERLDHLVAAHADAVVLDGELPLVGVEPQRDARLRIVAKQRRRGDRLVTQPFAGVGRIGDQFAQKYRFLGIDRVHHQLQQLGDVSLEGLGLEGWASDEGLSGRFLSVTVMQGPSGFLMFRNWVKKPSVQDRHCADDQIYGF